MTDLLDRPGVFVAQPPTPVRGSATGVAPAETTGRARPADWLLGTLLLSAGAIHLSMAPAHIAEKAALGWGFLLAAWAQVGLAVLVVAKPKAWTRATAAMVSAGLIGVWVASRGWGLPYGLTEGTEPIAAIDATCAALEVSALLLALWLLVRPRAARRGWAAFAGIAAAIAVIGATAAIASPSATAHGHGAAETDDLGFSELQNGQMAGHEHNHDQSAAAQASVVPMTPATRKELARQLATTAALVDKYPTIADAEKAGYWRAGPFAPGLGVHYNPPSTGVDFDGVLDDADLRSPMLIFAGLEPTAPLAGFMFNSFRDQAPEGFAGSLDKWHFHTNVCLVKTAKGLDTPFGADSTGVTREMCESKGGNLMDFTGYMVHVWTVPGYESPLGTFSDLNPKLTCEDGTYHRIPINQLGSAKSTCLDA